MLMKQNASNDISKDSPKVGHDMTLVGHFQFLQADKYDVSQFRTLSVLNKITFSDETCCYQPYEIVLTNRVQTGLGLYTVFYT